MRDEAFGLAFKSIDNSRVVREVDPRANRDLWWLLLLMGVLVGGILLYAWPHLQLRRTGIASEQASRERDRLVDRLVVRLGNQAFVRTLTLIRSANDYRGDRHRRKPKMEPGERSVEEHDPGSRRLTDGFHRRAIQPMVDRRQHRAERGRREEAFEKRRVVRAEPANPIGPLHAERP